MLTEPGTLEIWVDNQKLMTKSVAAGIQSIKAPLMTGLPKFLLIRDDATVIELVSAQQIISSPDYQDFHYNSGSAAASDTTAPIISN